MRATTFFTLLSVALSVSARPGMLRVRQADLAQNGKDADALNVKFATAKEGDACEAGSNGCVGGNFSQCVDGKFNAGTPCNAPTVCRALPLVNAAGTSTTCTTDDDFKARMAAAGITNPAGLDGAAAGGAAAAGADNAAAAGKDAGAADAAAGKDAGAAAGKDAGAAAADAAAGKDAGAAAADAAAAAGKDAGAAGKDAGAAAAAGGDAQTATTLDPSVIAKGFAQDGQDPPVAGQAASLTSTNNFINFCVGETITDGKQIKEGSCNPCPIGKIPSTANMPSSKFVFPPNNDASLAANTAFTIKMNIRNMETGVFVNAQKNYFSAPQQLNAQGQIIGHTHVVVEQLAALDSTEALDINKFAFFKGINEAAAGGVATAEVADGLPAGAYRICSINASSNHQPVIVPIAQHGAVDDCSYFTVGGAAAGKDAGVAAGKDAGAAAAAGKDAGAAAGAAARR